MTSEAETQRQLSVSPPTHYRQLRQLFSFVFLFLWERVYIAQTQNIAQASSRLIILLPQTMVCFQVSGGREEVVSLIVLSRYGDLTVMLMLTSNSGTQILLLLPLNAGITGMSHCTQLKTFQIKKMKPVATQEPGRSWVVQSLASTWNSSSVVQCCQY